jgi:hypothetical protein
MVRGKEGRVPGISWLCGGVVPELDEKRSRTLRIIDRGQKAMRRDAGFEMIDAGGSSGVKSLSTVEMKGAV